MSTRAPEPSRQCHCDKCRKSGGDEGRLVPATTYRRHNQSRIPEPIVSSASQGRAHTATRSTPHSPPSISRATSLAPAAQYAAMQSSQRVESSAPGSAQRTTPPPVQLAEEDVHAAALEQARRNQIVPDDPRARPETGEEAELDEPQSSIASFSQSQQFIRAVRQATVSNGDIVSDDLARLLNPPQHIESLDPDTQLALELFAATTNTSEAVYEDARQAIHRRYPQDDLRSLDSIKRLVGRISGVVPVKHDMCINSCIAFTGPFAALKVCNHCNEPRFDQTRLAASGGQVEVPRQSFYTMPIGPQLQALYRHPSTAEAMAYRDRKTRELRANTDAHGRIHMDNYDDVFCGDAYQSTLGIDKDDTVLMFSIDGAQLYRSKQSDVWIAIWVIYDLPPSLRYLKDYVLPSFVIPGPRKPKVLESFLLPSLQHLAAIQQEGLRVWNGARRRLVVDRPFVLLVTADGPAMQDLNGNNGHLATLGCRRFCRLKGRHKPQTGQYYPVMSAAVDFPGCNRHQDCNHPSVAVTALPSFDQATFDENLRYLGQSRTERDFVSRRQETGINKPSIFSGLPRILPVPQCCPGDLMHHVALNLPDVLLGLWRGTLDCDRDRGDSMTRWTWAVLRDEMWKAHGKTVADATPYLPGSFDRPPRNPAEKINSGYKAIEYLTYLFVLGPGLLYRILPEPYYSNFCMLVTGLRILHQRSISSSDLVQAHQYLLTFVADYEKIYYQQRTSRFHFVRQSIHSLTHVALEVQRLGPPGLYSQWTMERTIGNLGQEIRQPSNPYMNLSERAVRRAQLNAVRALMPGLASHSQRRAPRNAHNAGGGYSLRSARDETPVDVPQVQARALQDFLRESGLPPSSRTSQRGTLRVMRWARLALPNGQIARSEWKESGRAHGRGMRIARNVKVTRNSRSFIAEVLYYFLHRVEGFEEPLALAMVHRYSPPDTELLNQTHQALVVCTANRHDVYVVRVQEIRMVVGMVPLPTFGRLPEFPSAAGNLPSLPSPGQATRFFIAEKLGLELAQLGGVVTGEEEEED